MVVSNNTLRIRALFSESTDEGIVQPVAKAMECAVPPPPPTEGSRPTGREPLSLACHPNLHKIGKFPVCRFFHPFCSLKSNKRELHGLRRGTMNTLSDVDAAYCITSRQALRLLAQVAPFLRTYKMKRASLLLQDYARLTPRNGRYTPEQLAARAEFESRFFAISTRAGTGRGVAH